MPWVAFAAQPEITTPPQNRTVVEGSNHTFTVVVSGDAPLSYQWRRNSLDLPNRTNASLALTAIQTNEAGLYTVVVTNASGAVTSAPARLTVRLTNDPVYSVPQGGWSYLYDGTGVAGPLTAALDGTWNHENDSWSGDGRGAGVGLAGGLSSSNGVLTIEDAVSTTATGFNNRRYNFSRDLSLDTGVTNAATLINDGVTLTFRARLTPATDPLIEMANAPNGAVNNSDGKGMFGIRQSGGSGMLVSFSLNQAVEDTTTSGTFNFGQAGLHMNHLNGNTRSAVVDPGESGTLNLLPLNPAVFHEFWITMQDNGADPGTHRVSIYIDGNKVPTVFNVTAGTGVDGPFSNYLLLGLGNSSLQRGAVDVDFLGYRPGVIVPAGFNEPVVFVSQPTNAPVVSGQAASFFASVAGTPPFEFQWHRDGVAIPNATNATYTTAPVQPSDDSAQFTVVVRNELNSITSAPPALLQIVGLPSFTSHPQSLTVTNGDGAAFTAAASSVSPPAYQWRRNGTNLPGATSATLSIVTAGPADAGAYDVIASNASGSATSQVATLTVVMFDFGDAPNTGYPVTKAGNGARHLVVPGVFLGSAVDGEVDALPGLNATGDDAAGVDDEDGVVLLNPLRLGQVSSVQVVASTGGVLNAWLDWDQNNSWAGAGEQIFTNVVLVAGTNLLNVAVPNGAVAGSAYARLRFATTGDLQPDGPAADGEVEDYALTIFSVADLHVTLADAPDPVGVGSNLTYTIVVTNAGPLSAADVVVSNLLPATVTFVSATPSAGSCSQNFGVVRCELGVLANGAAATIAILVHPSSTGEVTNTASVSSAAIDTVPGNDTAAVTTSVLAPPAISSPPQNLTVASGTTATLSVTASGAAPLQYQWRFNGADLSGRTNVALAITNVQPGDSGSYSVRVFNAVGAVLSPEAQLTVIVPPTIQTQPQNSTNFAGSDVTLSVAASGAEPLIYRWYYNSTNLLADLAGPTLTLDSIQSSNSGIYRVTISNAVAVTTSVVATVTVIEADFGDAPDGYLTAFSTNGAWHRVVPGVRLGAAIDFEPDANLNSVGTGDDLVGVDDEDGVTFGGPLRTGQSANVAVVASTNGVLNAWVDFNRNGSWADPGDQVFTNRAVVTGTNNLSFPVPLSASAGGSFGRFRFSTAVDLAATGEALDGEVEDHAVTIEALADLAVASVQQIAPVAVGSNQVYSIIVSNAGPASATGVALTDTLPPGMTFVSATPSQGSCSHSAGIVACPLGPLPANGTVNVVIVAIPNSVGLITNLVSVGGGSTDVNSGNNTTSVVAVVSLPPEITTQPQSLSVTNGDTAAFNVAATGAGLSYQWAREQVDLPGATNATLTVTNAQAANAGSYTARVSNDVGSVLSAPAVLTVLGPATITTQPQSQTVLVGSNVTLSVVATGTAPLMYQWELNGVDLPGQTGSSLVLNNVQTNQSGSYRVRVSNVIRSVTSSPATLTVLAMPAFVLQPASATNYFASTAVLSSLASGTQPLRYQWYFEATNRLTSATNASLTLTNLQLAQAGNYFVVASNLAGVATSAVAVLSVYMVDYGDAPEALGYPTTLAFNGARHRILPGVRLGPQLDSETNGLPNVTATGDDFSGVDDEDGVTLPGVLLLGQIMNVPVVASTNGFLDAWIDFNADGAWTDSGEQILTSHPLVAGTNVVGLPISVAASLTNTFARFRFSTAGGLSYEGFAPDGEVEDYPVIIRSAIDLGVTLVDSIDPVPVPGVLSYGTVLTNRGPSLATGVWLTNVFPASFAIQSVTNSQGSCTINAGRVICNVGTLAPEQSMMLNVTVAAPVAGNFSVRAATTATENEAKPADNSFVQPTAVIVPAAEFTNLVSIAVADATAAGPGAGNPYPSTIQVSGLTGTVYKVTATLNNVSHNFAGDLDVLLVGPRGQSVLLMSDTAGPFVLSGVTITFDDDAGISLPSGGVIASTSYRPTAYELGTDLFPPPAPAAPFGTAMSVFSGTDPNGVWSLYVIDDEVNDTGNIATGWRLNISTADPMADVAVSGTDSPDPVAVGSNVVYTITVTNHGPSAATGVLLTNRIPSGVTFVSAVPSQGSCAQQGGVVACQLASLAPSGFATVAINVVTPSLTRYTNTASVTASQVDFVPSNNVALVETTARFPVDVLVAQTASTNLVILGQPLTYTLNVTNRGPNVAPNVRLVNPLPPNVSFVSVSSPQASCTNDAGVIRCLTATLASGARAQVTLVVQPAAIGAVTNVATVSSDEAEILPANNVSALSTVVNVFADVGLIAVTHAPDPVAVSNLVTTSIAVTNRGPAAASAVEVQVPLAAGLAFVSANVAQGSCTNENGTLRCALGTLPANGTNLVTLSLQPTALGRLTNVVSLLTGSVDSDGSNNTLTNVITVELPPFLVSHPASVTVTNGGSAGFAAVADGSPVLAYQWQWNETNILGATNASLSLSNVTYAERGAYRVRVANNVGIAFSTSATLTVLVPPSISDLTNRVVEEDSPTIAMAFTIGDVDGGVAPLTLSAVSSNPSLLPTNRLAFAGSGSDRTVEFTPLPNASGAVTITVEVRDADGLTATDTFVVTVNAVNDPPTLGAVTNQTMLEDGVLELNLAVDDIDSALTDLQWAVVSSNPGLVASTNVTFGGNGTNRTLTLHSATNESGIATLTLSLSDTNGAVASTQFTVTVLAVNDPPTLAPLANRVLNQGAGQQTVQLTNITAGATNEIQALMVTAISSDPAVVPHPDVTYTSPGQGGQLVFAPVVETNATVTITVTVDDGGETNRTVSQSFKLTLRVLAAPVITGITWTNGAAHITFSSEAGLNCVVEHKDSVTAPAWSPLPSLTATGSVTTISDLSATVSNRVYRVRVQ